MQRAGLLATQAIRGGANRRVLEGIKATGDIFMAWSDRKWVLDGAAVQVSMVGFDAGAEDGVHARRRAGEDDQRQPDERLDLTQARRLGETWLLFMGDTKGGAFDLPNDEAGEMLAAAAQPERTAE